MRRMVEERLKQESKREAALDNPTWTKISSGPHQGEWGARIEGEAAPGDRIEMIRKDGSRSTAIVDEIVWSGRDSWSGKTITIAALRQERAPRREAVRREPPKQVRREEVEPEVRLAAPAPTAVPFVPVEIGREPALCPDPARKWSPQQLAIFQETLAGKGHVVVLARAGAGKSTSAEQAIRCVPQTQSVLFTAFAKKIFQEAEVRFKTRPAPNVEVMGINSYGFRVVKRNFPQIPLDRYKTYSLSDGIVGDGSKRGDYGKAAKKALVRTVGMMKEKLTYDPAGIDRLIDKYDIDAGADLDLTDEDVRGAFINNAIKLLEASKADTSRVDFNDQIWFPIILNLPPGRLLYDYVYVDECQDLSEAKLELVMRAVKKSGRVFAIGDDRQAIFGFAGADEEAVPHIIERLRAKILKLTISYRCARKIAELARAFVPDFESGKASDGVVEEKSYDQMLREAVPGDFILSRVNAPLVKICMTLLRAGKKAVIAGKEDAIGKALLQLIETAEKKGAKTVIELQTWTSKWADREVERLLAKKPPREEEAEMVSDKVGCIDALAQGAGSIREIAERIEGLFSDEDNETRIVCSSTHKAKGLERERAWVLRNTFMKRPGTQEENLWYVALTRAKEFLFLVDLPARGEE